MGISCTNFVPVFPARDSAVPRLGTGDGFALGPSCGRRSPDGSSQAMNVTMQLACGKFHASWVFYLPFSAIRSDQIR